MRCPWYSAPTAHAASSITISRWRLAISQISLRAAGSPTWCTNNTARVRGVIALSMQLGSMLYVTGSTSTNTGIAPAYLIALAVAMNERLGHNTSSPGSMPTASSARCSAVVHDDTATALCAPTYSANAFSNSATLGPWLTQPLRRADSTACSSSVPIDGRVSGIVRVLIADFVIEQPPMCGDAMLASIALTPAVPRLISLWT